ncbi:transcription elongation factor TFIIS [Coemansia sp. RSA 1722]|nr:transcription elongation factor TFIIS [Coemansia sp. RSA 1722]
MSESASRHEELKALCKGLSEAQEAKNKTDLETLLNKLIGVVVEEKLLRATGAGQVVGRLRNYEDASIATLAKKVVHKWKKDVMASNARAAKTTNASAAAAATTTTAAAAAAEATGKAAGEGTAAIKKQQLASTSTPTGTSSVNSKNGQSSAQSSGKSSTNHTPSGSNTPVLSTRPSANNGSSAKTASAQRTAASDNVDLAKTSDPVRDKCIELLYNSMSLDSDVTVEILANLATGIEDIEFGKAKTTTPTYRAKIRSLCLNLRDKKNPELLSGVVSGQISVERLCSMTSEEMASKELKATINKMKEENILNSKAPVAEVAETDQFRCGRCKGRRCTYFQMQTRSADEPMTTFVTCLDCTHRWKFS